MRRLLVVGATILAVAALAAISLAPAAPIAGHHDLGGAFAAGSCSTKHCPSNTHCCYSCDGSPICVRNGVPCPECAPQ